MAVFSPSRWDTTYTAPAGPVHAIVTFNQNTGGYNVIDDNDQVIDFGTMSNVKYFIQSDNDWLITGHWLSNGVSGSFQFNGSGGPDQFTGGWLYDSPQHGGGSWTGVRII
jgi:hypothetical protein